MMRFVAAMMVLGLALGARAADAHSIGLSRGHYTALPDGIDARLVFDGDELGRNVLARDPSTDGAALEPRAVLAALERRIVHPIRVRDRDGNACPGVLWRAESAGEGRVAIWARYRCEGELDASSVELEFWGELTPGHRHLASTARAGAGTDRASSNEGTGPRADGWAADDAAAKGSGIEPESAEQILHREGRHLKLAPAPARHGPSPLEWVLLGVEHIAGGYDHLLFLLALVLVTPALRTLTATVSIFTLAHSLTLALATLQVFAPAPALVECAIALSITFVGLENLTERATRPRYLAVFAFGLIHGFGFAGALAELGLPPVQTPGALFAFNVGVELGQLGILGLAYPLRQSLCQTRWFIPRGVPALSVCTACAGVFWFIERL
jgi:hydrogenase/urease accessory protein HupE